jgi:hypothetical protein
MTPRVSSEQQRPIGHYQVRLVAPRGFSLRDTVPAVPDETRGGRK